MQYSFPHRFYRSALSGAVAAVAIAITPGAGAAEEPATDDDVEEITVLATRTPRDNFRVPQMVSVIDSEQIEDRLASTVSEIFEGMPGVQFSGGPRRTGQQPSIRGLSGPGVQILIDGARQSFLSGHDGRFFIDPDLLSRAEVVKGPGSALYGSGALGGVMALETLSAEDLLEPGRDNGLRVKSAYQGVNNESLLGATAFGRTERFDVLANITRRSGGDIELGSGEQLRADDNITSRFLKGSVQVTPSLEWTTSLVDFTNEAVEPNSGDDGSPVSEQNPLVDKEASNDTLQSAIDYNPDNPWIDLSLVGYRSDNEVIEAELDTPRVAGRRVETRGLRLDNQSRFQLGESRSLTLSYGGEYYEDEQDGFDSTTPDNERGGVPDASTEFVGGYAQGELDLDTAAGRLLLVPGVRYDRYDNSASAAPGNDDSELSPRFSLSYEPLDWAMLFASYAEAFRAPTFNEVFADGVHFRIPLGPGTEAPNFFVPNQDLESVRSETVEFGGGLEFSDLLSSGDRLSAKASYYHSDVDNMIGLEVNTELSPGCFAPGAGPCTSGTSRNVNTEEAEIDGIELQANYSARRFFARASFSAIEGVNKRTGEFVGIMGPDTFYLDAGVRVPELDLHFGSRTEIAGTRDQVNDPALVLEPFEKVDIYAVWKPASGPFSGLRLDVGVDNVGDEEFARIAPGALSPGRNLKVSLHYDLGNLTSR